MPKPFILVDPAGELPNAFAGTGGRLARSWRDLSRLLSRYTAGTVWVTPRVEAVRVSMRAVVEGGVVTVVEVFPVSLSPRL